VELAAAALARRRAEAVGPAPLSKGPGTLSVTDFPTGRRFGSERGLETGRVSIQRESSRAGRVATLETILDNSCS